MQGSQRATVCDDAKGSVLVGAGMEGPFVGGRAMEGSFVE